jgi:mRNA interferase MazF
MMGRSEIWWADLPPPIGRRPVLILTRSSAVRIRDQLVVAQITTTIHNLPCEVVLTQADGMPRNCVANCDVIITVPKSRLISRITKLSNQKMQEVHQSLKYALEIP